MVWACNLARDLFMVDLIGEAVEKQDETRDWRRYAIPAMGSLILILLGVIFSLVSIDRGGIKSDLTELKAMAAANKGAIETLSREYKAKDQEFEKKLAEFDLLIKMPYNDRARLFYGPGGALNQGEKGVKNGKF